MSETKQPRAMTAKRFATATLSAKATAEGFLSAHRTFLQKYNFVSPILQAYDQKELLPTVALQTIQSALMSHFLQQEVNKAQAKMEAAEEAAEVPTNRYTITLMCKVYDKNNQLSIQVGTVREITGYRISTPLGPMLVNTKDEADGHPLLEKIIEVKPAVWSAADYGAAMRLADRRLFQREDSVYATIVNNHDRPITTNVQRGDAIARMLRQPKGAVSRARGISTKSLGFAVHAKPTRDVWHLKK